MASLSSLPNELLIDILHHLPITCLLAFGSTSKENRDLQQCSLSSLRLGVFHTRLCGLVSLMDATANNDCLHSVQMILPAEGSRNKDCVVYMQNQRVQAVVRKYRCSLRNLEIAMWELESGTANLLATLHNLKHLHIRLDHPHTRHPAIKPGFWQESPGSTVWNLLATKVGVSNALRRLHTLNLERAGITDYQLREILKGNPGLRELYLRKCYNLTKETFKYVSASRIGQQLEMFAFTMSNSEQVNNRVLDFIGRMVELKYLCLEGCRYIDSSAVKEYNEQWRIPIVIFPSMAENAERAHALEVDPAYR